MRRTLLPVAALLALLATTGCTAALTPAATDRAGRPDRRVDAPSRDEAADTVALTADQPDEDVDDVDEVAEDSARIEAGLRELWLANDVRGTAPQIALRFMQALQRGDDLAAARELLATWRISDAWALRRVMDDVRRHARLEGAGACTRAMTFREGQVIVACGRQRVMVPALSDPLTRGVDIFGEPLFFGRDPYRHPHTWAITTVEL